MTQRSNIPRADIAIVVPVLDDFWHFRYVENPDGFWSLLSDASASAFGDDVQLHLLGSAGDGQCLLA